MREVSLEDLPRMPPRDPDTHKGTYGRVLVVGGSTGMTGAAIMASLAALRSGAGLVYLAIAESLDPIVEVAATAVVSLPAPEGPQGYFAAEAAEFVIEKAGRVAALVLGPGLGAPEHLGDFVLDIIRGTGVPVLLDADGLNRIAGRLGELGDAGERVVVSALRQLQELYR